MDVKPAPVSRPVIQYLDPDCQLQQFSPSAVAYTASTMAQDSASGSNAIATTWIRYADGKETVVAALFDAKTLTPITEPAILDESGDPHSPRVECASTTPVVFWIANEESCTVKANTASCNHSFRKQRIAYSKFENGRWSEPTTLVTAEHILSFDTSSDEGAVWVTWCSSTGTSGETISVAKFANGDCTIRQNVEAAEGLNRPVVCATDVGCTVVYDRYAEGVFSIHAAETRVDASAEIRASTIACDAEIRQLSPVIARDNHGILWTSWLTLVDVVDENGIVDQRPTLRAAVLSDGEWIQVADESGSFDLADLSWGLLSMNGAAVWGYLGRRRKPLLVPDLSGNGVFLLWERKAEHDGNTAESEGHLCGRRLELEGKTPAISQTSVFATGPRGYEPVRVCTNQALLQADRQPDRLRFVGRAIPAESTNKLILGTVAEPSAFAEQGSWDNWTSPVPSARMYATPGRTSPNRTSPDRTPLVRGEAAPYWADLHVHTGLSADAEGFVDEIARYAQGTARLDVVLLQDNDHYNLSLTSAEYEYLQRRADELSRDGSFLVIPGFEWTHFEGPDRKPSHRTVFGKTVHTPLLRNTEAGPVPTDALSSFAREHDAIVHIHHERFTLIPNNTDQNLEVCSGWKLHMANDEDRDFFHDLLLAGNRLGFVGGSDSHRRNPGAGGALTGIFADELNRESVVDALSGHRCFATNGARLVPRLEISGAFIGSEITISTAPDIRISVEGAKPGAAVYLIRDGERVFETRTGSSFDQFNPVDNDLPTGEHFYYLEVVEDATWHDHPSNLAPAVGGMAWTSPIWVTRCTNHE